MRRRIGRTAAIVATAAAMLAAAATGWAAFTAGSPGLGDPFFPLAGNGGYDVANYSLKLDYTPATNRLVARETITATATQDLASFDLDLRGFAITRLRVNGNAAPYARDGQELKITPRRKIKSGARLIVKLAYAGEPTVVTDPDESIEGWVPTGDGAFVVGEPQGSPGWYAVNDSPRDKATYDFRITVPAGLTAMANGALVSQSTRAGRSTWVWREGDPMAPHLATVTNGRFDLTRYRLHNGTPVYIAVDPQLAVGGALAKLPEIVKFFSSIYGPYPFGAVGAIVDSAAAVGYALETQTKPVFASVPSEATLAHELGHQWFGDSVTLTQWPQIWLHEGFAKWSEWIWSEHEGNETAAQWFDQLYSTPASNDAFWNPPPGNPGSPALLFDRTIYYRSAMTLEALREKVGDRTFFRILREWAQRNRFRNVTTAQFVAFAGRVSRMNLQHFFDVWLYQPGKPTSW